MEFLKDEGKIRVRRRGKAGEHGKVGVKRKEKVVGFNSASLFPARKREPVTQGGTI